MPFNPVRMKATAAELPVVPFQHCAAKTTADQLPGTTVFEHCRNVGFVAQALARILPSSLRVHLSENPALPVSMHDVGKVSPGFALKYFERTLVQTYAPALCGLRTFEKRHAAISAAAIDRWLGEERMVAPASIAAAAHHGTADRSYPPDTSELLGGQAWADERRKLIRKLIEVFGGNLEDSDKANPALLAGLTCVADWIGSDETFFPADGLPIEAGDSAQTAAYALAACGFGSTTFKPGLSFVDVFGFIPREAQSRFIERVDRPGVYILEAPMGIGKTEAALYAAYRLMAAGHHHGFYFALPTRLTSDRIHTRVSTFLSRITDASVAPRLAHGMAWLSEFERGGAEMKAGSSWFNPMKRALLYPYAVGTIDQALLAVMNVRHGFVRQFGLAGKVVILDEVHSYDVYTGALLDELVSRLQGIGCTVIILSATLTGARRRQLVPCLAEFATCSDYPLLTGKSAAADAFAAPLPPLPDVVCAVRMEPWNEGEVASEAVAAALRGECVVGIANTVAKAQSWFKAVKSVMPDNAFAVGILHSRFPMTERQKIEERWMQALGSPSESGSRPHGCVLIATQILEQSVDIDADWMLSELAPSDMLLQRMGRLWRHKREARPRAHPELVIVTRDPSACGSVEAVAETLGKENCCVYAPYVQMRTHAVWKERRTVTLPSDIRPLIEATYADPPAEETEVMRALRRELQGKSERLRKLACSAQDHVRGIPTGADDERAATRYSDLPTRTVLLLAGVERLAGWDNQVRVRLLDGQILEISSHRPDFAATRILHAQTVSLALHLLPNRGKVEQACGWLDRHFFDKPIVLVCGDGGWLRVYDGPETTLGYSADFGVWRGGQAGGIAQTKVAAMSEDDAFDPFDKVGGDW
jgi:CRISPR-associated endonuclease/helicase Cas3